MGPLPGGATLQELVTHHCHGIVQQGLSKDQDVYKFRINLFTEMLLNLKTEKNDAALVELKGRWSQYKNLIHCLPKD